MNDFDMDTLPGGQQSVEISSTTGFRLHQPLRIRMGDPISVLPAMFARSTASIAVVLNDQDVPLGVIRPGALLRAVEQHGRDSLASLAMQELMDPVKPVSNGSTIGDLVALCTRTLQDFVVVVDANQRLAGIATAQDLLRVTESLLASIEDGQARPIMHFMKELPVA